jgi:hypothetical protein
VSSPGTCTNTGALRHVHYTLFGRATRPFAYRFLLFVLLGLKRYNSEDGHGSIDFYVFQHAIITHVCRINSEALFSTLEEQTYVENSTMVADVPTPVVSQ